MLNANNRKIHLYIFLVPNDVAVQIEMFIFKRSMQMLLVKWVAALGWAIYSSFKDTYFDHR